MELIKEIFVQIVFSSLKLSVIVGLLFILTKPITKRYTAGFRYYSWLAVIIVFLIPFGSIGVRYKINITPTIMDIRNKTHSIKEWYDKNVPAYSVNEEYIQYSSEEKTEISKTSNVTKKVDMVLILAVIWILGVFIYFTVHLKRYIYYKKTIQRISSKLDDVNFYSILEEEKNKLKISDKLCVRISGIIDTPMLIGIFRPKIILPHLDYTDYEFRLILRHELFHFKRKDILYQLIVLIFVSLHWFNPIVHLMAKAIEIDGETSCDEKTLENEAYEEKIFYGEMLLKFLKMEIQKKSYMTTTFFGGKNGMKKRLTLIADKKARLKGTAAMIAVLIITVMASISVSAIGSEYFDMVFEGDTSYLADFIKTEKKSVEDDRFILTLEQYLVAKGHIMIIFSFEAKTEDAVAELNAVDKRGFSTFFDMDTIVLRPTDFDKADINGYATAYLGRGKFDTKNKKYFYLKSESIVNEENIDFYLTTDKIKDSPKIIVPMDYNLETKTLKFNNITVEYNPISIFIDYPTTEDDRKCDWCETGTYFYFRMKNGEIKTFNQLYDVKSYGRDFDENGDEIGYYAWAKRIIEPDEIKSIIVNYTENDIEYPVDNPSKAVEIEIDDSMKPFSINSYYCEPTNSDYQGPWWIPLEELCNGLGAEVKYDKDMKSAEFKYQGSEYIITVGKNSFLKDGEECDLGDVAPFIGKNGQMIVPGCFNNWYSIDYTYVDCHLYDRFYEDEQPNPNAKWHVIP